MEKRPLVPVFEGPLEDFPSMEHTPDGVQTLHLEDTFGYDVDLIPCVPYSSRDGETQQMHILVPRGREAAERFPLVTYVQGSAWHRQRVFQHLPHMIRVAQRGFAVALVEYRPSDIAPFPAQMVDAKTAIRFLRMHAEEYGIDPDRVAIWGDSSGGHTALITGITGDRQPDTDLYGGYSCAVSCIVDWYGPTDISRMNEVPSTQDHIGADSPEGYLIGRKNVLKHPQLAAETVPMNYLSADIPTPPVLILHGSRDHLVNFEQSCFIYNTLRSMGKEVTMYRLEGAYHGFGGFNNEKTVDLCIDFLRKHLK